MGSTVSNPRVLALAAIPVVALAVLLSAGPIPQNLAYHDFADRRVALGIANFANVASNLGFLVAGLPGLLCGLRARTRGAGWAWLVFFCGVMLVAVGSAYYHLRPGNGTLVWDRLPMTVAFSAAYVALLAEYVSSRLERALLVPALIAGAASVGYWAWTDNLAFYFALQATLFASGLWILIAFAGRRREQAREKAYVALAFGCYGVSIVFEHLDREVFALTGGTMSGHTLKHLLAALAPFWIYRMVARRQAAAPAGI